MLVLAAADPRLPPPESFSSVGWAVVVFFGIMGGLYYTLAVLKHFRPKDAARTIVEGGPISIEEAKRFATLDQHLELKDRVDDIAGDIREGFLRLDGKRSTSIANLHDLVRADGANIAALQAETQKQSADLVTLSRKVDDANTRIDAVPGRTVQLLRDTKGLL